MLDQHRKLNKTPQERHRENKIDKNMNILIYKLFSEVFIKTNLHFNCQSHTSWLLLFVTICY